MYEEVKQILDYLADRERFRFTKMFNKLQPNLLERDREKIKRFLNEEDFVEEVAPGETFGPEQEYEFSKAGTNFLHEMQEAEIMDKVLQGYVQYKNRSYVDINKVYEELNITPSKITTSKLERGNFITACAPDKSGIKTYEISSDGEDLLTNGGFKQQLVDYIDEKILQIRKQEKVMKKQESLREYQGDIDKYFPEKPVTNVTNVHTQNYFHNQHSKIEEQAGTINEAPPAPAVGEQPKKTHWLQIVAWIIAIVGGLAGVFKIFFM